jgi:hypothetical protein
MTQTVILTQPVRVSGSVLAAGTTQTLARDVAADLVQRGFATPVGVPAWQSPAQNVARVIAASNIPFFIMPGDGGSNGCSFSGTEGDFTLSAAIIANIGTTLAGCYAYFSADFGGSTLPAGWYWTEFSSDTAGIVYSNTYTSGPPKRPTTKTPISVNLTGRITASTSEIVGPNNFLLPANALGKNGALEMRLRQAGSTAGTKSFRVRADDQAATIIAANGSSVSPIGDSNHALFCIDSHTAKSTSRQSTASNVSVAQFGTSYLATQYFETLDTQKDIRLSISMQQSSNVSTPILLGANFTVTYGE